MIGQTVGQYHIISKLGEGGMGAVFEAEQQHPKRRVALKIIRSDKYVDENTIRMFQREAQSLALLKHTSIASIYESGRTEDGQHFFAMELVQGKTLTEWLEDRSTESLSQAEVKLRLDLFRKICDGVSYAHQRGVIHRDLKPENILVLDESEDVTESSSASGPSIKILDFGLSRITESDVAVATMVTEVGTMLGTLPYMSPEQVKGIPEDIDVRSDVYALGVLLYEILTGQLPYPVLESSFHEAVRLIIEVTPKPISKIWLGEKKADRDLEVIAIKALEKEPVRRYQSALALSEDIDRFLNNQPILARPPSTVYQIRKMVKRHTVPSVLTAAMVVLIIGFSFVSVAQARRAERARDESEAVTEFLSDMLAAADPTVESKDVKVLDLIAESAGEIGTKFEDKPLIRARLHHTIGEVYTALSQFTEAEEHLLAAIEVRRRELGDKAPNTLQSIYQLAANYYESWRLDEGLPLVLEAFNGYRSTQGKDAFRTLVSKNLVALYYLEMMRLEEAEPIAVEALAQWRDRGASGVVAEEGEKKEAEERQTALNTMFGVYLRSGQFTEAESIAPGLLEGDRRVSGPTHPYTLASMHNVAYMYQLMKRWAEAESLYVETLELRQQIEGPEHDNTLGTMGNLAEVYAQQGSYAEAEALFIKTLEICTRTLGDEYWRVPRYLSSFGSCLVEQGKHVEAEPVYTRLLDIYQRTESEGSMKIFDTMSKVGACLVEMGRYNEAESLLLDGYGGIEDSTEAPEGSLHSALEQIIRLYELWEKPDKAGEWRAKLPPGKN